MKETNFSQTVINTGRSVSRAGKVATLAVGLLVSSATLHAGTQGTCPAPASAKTDYKYKITRANTYLKKCIYVVNDHRRSPSVGQTIYYNIYCPGRMTKSQARAEGLKLVRHARVRIRDSRGRLLNPIHQQHNRAWLSPTFTATPHVYHYWCNFRNKRKVATHIKVGVRSTCRRRPHRYRPVRR